MNDNHKPDKTVLILVNNKDVEVPDKDITGLIIKQAAIAQGVNIKIDFLVYHDLPNGSQAQVLDDQAIKVHRKERFDVMCNDDHS